MSNPVVTAAVFDPAITDPAVTNIVMVTQGRLNNLIARGRPYLLLDEVRFDLQHDYRVDGEPPTLTPLAV